MTAPTSTRADQKRNDTQPRHVGAGTTSPRATEDTTPNPDTPVGDQLLDQATAPTTPIWYTPGRGHTSGSGQVPDDTQARPAAAGTNIPADHGVDDTHGTHVGGEHTEDGSAATTDESTPIQQTSLADPFLALAADVLDDTERTKIANQNRLRQLTRTEEDSDGQDRGFGLDASHPDVARLAALVDLLAKVEHNAVLNLQRLMRKHPLGPWCKAQVGIGEKQGARLLAVIGDPYWHDGEDRPRTVSELWSYCGHGDARRRLRKGMTQAELFACGSPVAKSRLWLIASKTIMFDGKPSKNGEARPRSAYRDVYDARKTNNEGRLHADACRRCGPSGKPAQAGSAWSDGHRHADALRIVGKAILHDLFVESMRIHEESA